MGVPLGPGGLRERGMVRMPEGGWICLMVI